MAGDGGGTSDFEDFYRASYGGLVAHIYALTGDISEAQEAAQETFVRAWRDWEKVIAYDHPEAWIRLVGRRIAVSRWRRARTAVRSWVRHGAPDDLPEPGPESVALVRALRVIPEAQRRAVVLHHMGGRSVAEIAEEEGVPEGTIKARLSRGRQALAGLLADTEAAHGRDKPQVAAAPRSSPSSREAVQPEGTVRDGDALAVPTPGSGGPRAQRGRRTRAEGTEVSSRG